MEHFCTFLVLVDQTVEVTSAGQVALNPPSWCLLHSESCCLSVLFLHQQRGNVVTGNVVLQFISCLMVSVFAFTEDFLLCGLFARMYLHMCQTDRGFLLSSTFAYFYINCSALSSFSHCRIKIKWQDKRWRPTEFHSCWIMQVNLFFFLFCWSFVVIFSLIQVNKTFVHFQSGHLLLESVKELFLAGQVALVSVEVMGGGKMLQTLNEVWRSPQVLVTRLTRQSHEPSTDDGGAQTRTETFLFQPLFFV